MVQRFTNLKVIAKFLVLTLVFMLFLGGCGLFSLWALQRTEKVYAELLERQLAIQTLVSGVKVAVTQSGLSALEYITAIDPNRKAVFENEIEASREQLTNLIAAYKEQELSQEEIRAFMKFETALNNYLADLNNAVAFHSRGEHLKAQNYYLNTVGRKNMTFLALEELEGVSNERVQALQRETNNIVARIRYNVALTLIGALVVSTGISLFIGRGFSRRLKRLESYVRQGATGDLTMDVIVDGTDEMGALAASFRRMIDSFRQLIQEVREGADRSAQVAEDFLSSINETSRAVEQVNRAIQEVAAGANEQASSAAQAAEMVDEIFQAVETTNDEVQRVRDNTEQVLRLIEEGLAHLDNQNRAVMDSTAASDKVAAAITNLHQMSQKIGDILDTISQFADQTNLLALNAAIEAARAGEHGRGFAVVAEEVRKLAEGSAQAAGEIARIVQEIQQGAKEAVQNMETAQATNRIQKEAVEATDRIFRRISEGIKGVAHSINEVAEAERQIVERTESITDVINRISSVAEEDAAAAEEVSASSQQQAAAMQELTGLAENLNMMSQNLKELIAQFKLEEETAAPDGEEAAEAETPQAEEDTSEGQEEKEQEE
ncbi:MAG TPA: methyl-accepting chemotaxis protein [Clostridia bacterium]|nr:methyl-accepting chemotaxis protein [Clostridia bacterium]